MAKKVNDPFPARLIAVRTALDFAQRDMAHALGVVHGAIGLWESGKRKIPGPVRKLIELYEQELGLAPPASPSAEAAIDALPRSRFARNARLTATGAYVTSQLALLGIKQVLLGQQSLSGVQTAVYAQIAARVVETLGRMKGMAQKLGQFISYINFHLPPAIRKQMATLQQLSPPMSAAVIAEQIVAAFGKTPRQLFAEWSETPFAAASIGQVHRATLASGEVVAVKVQYPGIREVLQSDLANAGALERLASYFIRGHTPGELVQEIYERLFEECDYRHEAAAQTRFQRWFADDTRVVIPRVYPAYSAESVLTSALIEGDDLTRFARRASQVERNRAGEIIFDFVLTSLCTHHTFNADPHPGNYRFLSDGRVAFLDFGCTKTLDAPLFAAWRNFIRAVLDADFARVKKIAIDLGVVHDIAQFDFEHFYAVMRAWYEPWYSDTPYMFTEEKLNALWKMMSLRNPNTTRMHFPKELLYLNNVQWGLAAVLSTLRASSRWSKRVAEWME